MKIVNKKLFVLTLLTATCLLTSSFTFLCGVNAESPWLSGYSKRTMFYVDGGEPLNPNEGVQASFTVRNSTGGIQGTVFNIYKETLPDFRDIRITLLDGTTVLPLWNQSTIFGVECTLWCLFPELNANYYLYWNNPNAETVWNEHQVFNEIIDDVALAMPLDEVDREVNPTVIVDKNHQSFWSVGVYQDVGGTCSVPVISNEPDGSLFISVSEGNATFTYLAHGYTISRDFSNLTNIKIELEGINNNKNIEIRFISSDGNWWYYRIVDDWLGSRKFTIPFSMFKSGVGTIRWNDISTFNVIYYSHGDRRLGRIVLDVDVLSVDYSGNNNNGEATGTIIIPHPVYANKNIRKFTADTSCIITAENVHNALSAFTCSATVKFDSLPTVDKSFTLMNDINNTGNFRWMIYTSINNKINIVTPSSFTDNLIEYNFIVGQTYRLMSVVTFDENLRPTHKLYVDGVLIGSAISNIVMIESKLPWIIGKTINRLDRSFKGCIGDVNVFLGDKSEFASVLANFYPDPRLVEGSIVMRNYVYPEPSFMAGVDIEPSPSPSPTTPPSGGGGIDYPSMPTTSPSTTPPPTIPDVPTLPSPPVTIRSEDWNAIVVVIIVLCAVALVGVAVTYNKKPDHVFGSIEFE